MSEESEWKGAKLKNFKLSGEGIFRALFAPFNSIDKQGDLTLPGAFGTQRVIISSYGHGSWKGDLPVGKGVIHDGDEGGIVEGQFFLDTTRGKDTYTIVKELGDLQEWNYALPEIDFEMREIDGRQVRILKRIRVPEVSPVLMGAGNGTRTLAIKAYLSHRADDPEQAGSGTPLPAPDPQKVLSLFKRLEQQTRWAYIEVSTSTVDPAVRAAAWAARDVCWRWKGNPWPLAIVFVREETRVKESAFNIIHRHNQRVLGWAKNLGDKIFINVDADPQDIPYLVAHEIAHILPPENVPEGREEVYAEYFEKWFVPMFSGDIRRLAAEYAQT